MTKLRLSRRFSLNREQRMDLIFVIAITLQITGAFSKKDSSSDESVDNILYYKDCNHEKEKEPAKVRAAESPPRQPECIPRMCCSMSCNNNCGQDQPTMTNTRQMDMQSPLFMSPGQGPPPPSPPLFTPRARGRRKKKPMQKPMGGRRSLGFTREHIKHLISQDEDIKKILKDLVRVTMQKVDLIDMINARRNGNKNAVTDRDESNTNDNEDGEIKE